MTRYKKLLVLLDLSDGSEHVAAAARDIAADANADVIALHVVEFVPVDPMGETMMPSLEIERDLVKRSGERLLALKDRWGLPNARCRVESGNTKSEILRVAREEGVDLIVLGSRERHGLAILVNFTEDTVLHASQCDVLAVRLQ